MNPDSIRASIRRRFSREEAVGLYLTLGVLMCGAIVFGFAHLVREVFWEAHLETDRVVTLWVRGLQGPGRDDVMRGATFLGTARFLLPATVLVIGGLLWRKHRVAALLFGGSVVGGFALSSIFKIGFHRARPILWPALVTEKTYSFPSGHATMSTVFFGGLAAVAVHLSRSVRFRAFAVASATAVVFVVAFSRVYLGVHWFTDVLGGVLVGLFWVLVHAAGTEFLARRRGGRPGPASGRMTPARPPLER